MLQSRSEKSPENLATSYLTYFTEKNKTNILKDYYNNSKSVINNKY